MAAGAEPLLAQTFRRLRVASPLTIADLEALQSPGVSGVQQGAVLAALSLRSDLTTDELALFKALARSHSDVLKVLGARAIALLGETPPAGEPPAHWVHAFSALSSKRPTGRSTLQQIVADIVSGAVSDSVTAAWLMTICILGMNHDDTRALTECMAYSGKRYDYRESPELAGSRLIRRYPTGALSEKVALILPSLISAARSRVAVCSPFLVARSLAHTGGTWDKLSAIPGFVFPEPGDASIRALKSCGVAMTVTQGDANPADRKLYQLRSATGTVQSVPLIVASIASKQLTFPVHRLLLDVRIGPGAFLAEPSEGRAVGQQVALLVSDAGIACSYTLTTTIQPNGTAIGNALEVAEAISVMGGPGREWEPRAVTEQRLIVVDFFTKLMAAEFPSISAAEWAHFAFEQLQSGAVLRAFAKMLETHGVADDTVANLLREPIKTLAIPPHPLAIPSARAGTLDALDQLRLGEIVNRTLGAGGNAFEGQFDPTAGIVLAARLGDPILVGRPLCRVFSTRDVTPTIEAEIAACFELSPL